MEGGPSCLGSDTESLLCRELGVSLLASAIITGVCMHSNSEVLCCYVV